MKLVMLAYLEGDEKCVDRLLADLDVTMFSRLGIEGHGPAGSGGWYGSGAPYRSGMILVFTEAEKAEAILAAGRFVPDVIVVAQAFPGQFSLDEIDRIRGLAPLARLLGLLGSWCEGEVRTGLPWPAVIRIPLSGSFYQYFHWWHSTRLGWLTVLGVASLLSGSLFLSRH